MRARRQALFAGQLVLLAVVCAVGVASSRAADWHPLGLFAVLLAVAVVSDLLAVEVGSLRIAGSFLALVLAMALLGPAPAAAIGVASMLIDAARLRPAKLLFINNLLTYATFPLAGGLVIRALAPHGVTHTASLPFALLVFAVFAFTNLLNFVMIAGHDCLLTGKRLTDQFRLLYAPVLPSELATGLLAVGIALIYRNAGMAAVALLAIVLFTFQYLLQELLVSQERGEELEQRTRELASLQVGVLTAMLQTLALRDHMTARHSAAVARYAREIARASGYSTYDQELVHTAGLLHDIGKFIFPDSILFANRKLTDEDFEIVKRHPAQGARVVRQVEGYGPVADIIMAHHERIDGGGYPRGISGDEIPALSRMISVADVYDVMTARDSYREPVEPDEAIAELRRVSGKQLDAQFVEVFIGLLEHGSVRFGHGDDADFEAELSFDRRVQDYAEPRGGRFRAPARLPRLHRRPAHQAPRVGATAA